MKLTDVKIKPYASCKHQLSVNDGCLLKHGDNARVVVPLAKHLLLLLLHRAHMRVDCMKMLARWCIWWPAINNGIERIVHSCDTCALHRNNLPNVPLHPWEFPDNPWQQLHHDFVGPFKNFTWLIVLDAHSKWPEVFKFQVGTTGMNQVISSLSQLFARFGIPKQLVIDNGPQFVAKEFQ